MIKKKIITAVTGASGAIYAKLWLDKLALLKDQIDEVAVIMSDTARQVWEYEIKETSYKDYPFTYYDNKDFFSPVASGSAKYDAMVVIPCSMGTMARISSGTADDLICRAADVMLKERKQLILVTRETPLNLIHLRNMQTITEAGGIICPASPSFYSHPKTIEDAVMTVVDRVIDLAKLENTEAKRWGE